MRKFTPLILLISILLILSTCNNEPLSPLSEDVKNAIDGKNNTKNQTPEGDAITGKGAVEGTIQKMNCFFEYLPVMSVLVKIKNTELSTTTSSNGFYRIEQIPEGTNILIVSNNYTFYPMPGNIERTIIIKNKETTYCNIDLPYVESIFPPSGLSGTAPVSWTNVLTGEPLNIPQMGSYYDTNTGYWLRAD